MFSRLRTTVVYNDDFRFRHVSFAAAIDSLNPDGICSRSTENKFFSRRPKYLPKSNYNNEEFDVHYTYLYRIQGRTSYNDFTIFSTLSEEKYSGDCF